jgi:hypothetical protein
VSREAGRQDPILLLPQAATLSLPQCSSSLDFPVGLHKASLQRLKSSALGFGVKEKRDHGSRVARQMPGGFTVDIAPISPLGLPHILTVKAVRTHTGARKTDWQAIDGPGDWQGWHGGHKLIARFSPASP